MANDKTFERSMNSDLTVALAGNPNCGKTTIFNRLTGERQAVGNYSGVTVEKVEGNLVKDSVTFHFVDLPGVYSSMNVPTLLLTSSTRPIWNGIFF